MVQTLLTQVQYADPVVYDWSHIKAPTLALGGSEDSLTPNFPERMKVLVNTIPGGKARLHLIPGLGHVPHMEAPEKFYPPLLAFLKES
jgi:pimeloyl-ACP methyl ester carboxylesterase